MKRIIFSLLLLVCFSAVFAQSVPFPTGNRNWEAVSPWGYTQTGTSWNTSKYLPFIYRDMWFRMMPPNGVTYNSGANTFVNSTPGKLYPLILFFHGAGEVGSDNNKQLVHGAQTHMNAVTSGRFPGFLVYPQNVSGGPNKAGALIEKLLATLPVDPNRIYVHGLSNGAKWAWDFLINQPTIPAAMAPMSGVVTEVMDSAFLFKPIRLAQGGLDTNPHPAFTQQIVDWYTSRGGNMQYFLFPNLGHGTWNDMYNRSDFFEWFLSKKINTIHVLFTNEICPEDPLVVTMGVTPGYQDYEWRRGSTVIASGPGKHKIKATQYGIYTMRLKNRGVWTDWSDPVEVKQKAVTATPPIQVSGLKSKVLPAPDGSVATSLELPEGYESYTWKNSTGQVVSNERIYSGATVGTYTAVVKEVYGCSSIESPVFTVINANGPNKPDPINGLNAYATSQTSVKVFWSDNPTPVNNETGFEVYRATSSSGPFKLVAVTAADVVEYNDPTLTPNTRYYYQIRPVNATSAAAVSEVIEVLTQVDSQPPMAPGDLTLVSTTANSVSLSWKASTDNVGVYLYDIYVNGVKALAVSNTTLSATVFGLTEGQVYNLTVKAKDVTGNVSPSSNQVTAATISSGLNYKYYEGTWSVLPNFNTLTPVKVGNTPNVDINVRNRDSNFAMYWEGVIRIPVAGNYTFETYSDDGSKLYIGGYSEANLVVNNDGGHGMQYREGTRNFPAAGTYPIVITYFNGTGGFGMNIYWKNTAHGVTSRQAIPNSAFVKDFTMPGNPPVAPTGLTAAAIAFNRIDLNWQDNSSNETGFQIYRSTANEGPYTVVATVGAGVKTYSDMTVQPSTRYFYRVEAIGQYGQSGLGSDKLRGLNYSYYEQTMSNLNSINSYTPVKTGVVPNFDISVRNRNENIAFKWEGKIKIPTAGNYTFYTRSDDGSTLFIDGTQIVSNDYNQGMTERSGVRNLTAGVHNIRVLYRNATGGFGLEVSYQGPGLSKRLIPSSALADDEANATTLPLPPPPVAPANLTAQALDSKKIRVSWTDNSTTEASFQLYRGVSSAASMQLYKTLPSNTTEFVDEGLFPRATYYYRVDAVNSTGGTSSSNVHSTATPNTSPSFETLLETIPARYGEETLVQVVAADADGDAFVIGSTNLPSFVQLFDYSDGTASLLITPQLSDIGVYPDLSIYAYDQFGGRDTLTFSINVNSNHNPVITGATPVTLRESYTSTLELTATDDDGQDVTWSIEGLPAFVTTSEVDNVLRLTITPGLSHAGTYSLQVTASDGVGGVDTKIIPLTVQDFDPNYSVSVNFGYASNAAAPWNNFMVSSATFSGFTSQTLSALKNNSNVATDLSVTVENPWQQAAQTGGVTPGLYPNGVVQSFFYHSNPTARTIKISGLNPDGRYNIKLLASRNLNDGNNRTTRFTINGVSQTVNANLNSATVDFNDLQPNASGEIVVSVERTVTYALLNAMIIESVYEATAAPAAPSNLSASYNASSQVQLNWTDNSGDETGFQIYRSTDNVEFELLATTAANASAYADATFTPAVTYYYKVLSLNAIGSSTYSNTVQIVGLNRAPVFATLDPISLLEGAQQSFTISATDPDLDAITFTTQGAPYFLSLAGVDNEHATLSLSPASGDGGIYQFEIIATDVYGAETVLPVTVTVLGQNEIKINFTNASTVAGTPWNNFTSTAANATIAALKNSSNTATSVSIRNVANWSVSGGGVNTTGPTGTNLFPDAVTSTSFFINSGDNSTRSFEFGGLNPEKLYEFTFFAGRAGVSDNRVARYTIGSKFVTLNAAGNASNVAKMAGVKSDASGKVTLVISKETNAVYAHIGAIVLREYEDSGLPNPPQNLSALTINRNSIKLNWTDASDNETGFEIWASAVDNAAYQLVATVGAGVTTYTHQGLTPGTKYFYKLRTVAATGNSPYTTEVQTATFDYAVSINFNAFNGGPANWNNISQLLISPDMVFNNLFDENNANTGISMTVVTPFTGDNPWGMSTGNNSGVVPDKVMEGSFWTDPGVVATLRFSNLSFLKKYNFVFFGSRNSTGNRTTVFTIGSASVQLNASLNTSQTVQINDIVPDPDGTVTVTIEAAAGAVFGYVNAIIIQATPNTGGAGARVASSGREADQKIEMNRESLDEVKTSAYPNPFVDQLSVILSRPLKGTTRIQVISLLGVEVYSDEIFGDGIRQYDLQLDSNLPSGPYILRINNAEFSTTQRLIKQ